MTFKAVDSINTTAATIEVPAQTHHCPSHATLVTRLACMVNGTIRPAPWMSAT